jgi:TFIIF-interacting CTD phosphatase-like protein
MRSEVSQSTERPESSVQCMVFLEQRADLVIKDEIKSESVQQKVKDIFTVRAPALTVTRIHSNPDLVIVWKTSKATNGLYFWVLVMKNTSSLSETRVYLLWRQERVRYIWLNVKVVKNSKPMVSKVAKLFVSKTSNSFCK